MSKVSEKTDKFHRHKVTYAPYKAMAIWSLGFLIFLSEHFFFVASRKKKIENQY